MLPNQSYWIWSHHTYNHFPVQLMYRHILGGSGGAVKRLFIDSKYRFAHRYTSYSSLNMNRLSYAASWWTSHTFLRGVRGLLHCRHGPRWGSVNLAACSPASSDWLRLKQIYDWRLVLDHHIFSSIWPTVENKEWDCLEFHIWSVLHFKPSIRMGKNRDLRYSVLLLVPCPSLYDHMYLLYLMMAASTRKHLLFI